MKKVGSLLALALSVAALFACAEDSGSADDNKNTGGTSGNSDTGGTSGDGNSDTGGTSGDGDTDTGGTSGDGDGDGTGGTFAMLPTDITTPKIMIVGDSISAGPGCYKKYLAEHLTNNGHSFEFVGEYTDDCGGGILHSAVGCTTSGQYTQETFTVPNCFSGEEFPGMAPLMATHEPDVVMIQLGVNDVWGGTAPIAPILSNYATLAQQARAQNPNVLIFVAQIHKIITDNCENMASTTKAQELVDALPSWASGISTEASPVVVADLWTNSDAMEANDCVHPDDAGARRMAANWYAALEGVIP